MENEIERRGLKQQCFLIYGLLFTTVYEQLKKNIFLGDLRSVSSDPSSSTLCPTICRRAASFPIVNGHHPAPSLLRVSGCF